MGGLRRLCRLYGSIKIGDARHVWDYALDEPALEKDMPVGSERWKASEKARAELIKREINDP